MRTNEHPTSPLYRDAVSIDLSLKQIVTPPESDLYWTNRGIYPSKIDDAVSYDLNLHPLQTSACHGYPEAQQSLLSSKVGYAPKHHRVRDHRLTAR